MVLAFMAYCTLHYAVYLDEAGGISSSGHWYDPGTYNSSYLSCGLRSPFYLSSAQSESKRYWVRTG